MDRPSSPRLDAQDEPRETRTTPPTLRRRRPYLGTIAVPITCLAIFGLLALDKRSLLAEPSMPASDERSADLARQRRPIDRIADARALPEHDVDANCAEFGRKNGPDGRRACLQVEQRNYDFLRIVWPTLTDRTRAFCMKTHDTLKSSAMRYGVLGECVAALLPSDRLDQQGPFRRW